MPDYDFWNERWVTNQIGFHMDAPHNSLVEFIDLFKLSEINLEGITCCYDRASMVAFNYEERVNYSQFLINKVRDLEQILAPLLDYGDIQDAGPPFSVTETELTILYGKNFELKKLKNSEIPLRENFKSKGASYAKEVTWFFSKK